MAEKKITEKQAKKLHCSITDEDIAVAAIGILNSPHITVIAKKKRTVIKSNRKSKVRKTGTYR